MEHIKDLQNRGHEVIILRDTVTQLYAVDIRDDAADGEIIAGYAEFPTEDDARRVAFAYIDGLVKAARQIQGQIQQKYGV